MVHDGRRSPTGVGSFRSVSESRVTRSRTLYHPGNGNLDEDLGIFLFSL